MLACLATGAALAIALACRSQTTGCFGALVLWLVFLCLFVYDLPSPPPPSLSLQFAASLGLHGGEELHHHLKAVAPDQIGPVRPCNRDGL